MGVRRWEFGDGSSEMGVRRWEFGDGSLEMGVRSSEMGDGRWEMGDGSLGVWGTGEKERNFDRVLPSIL
jgi:hypothetical protein